MPVAGCLYLYITFIFINSPDIYCPPTLSVKERVALLEKDMPKLIDTSDGQWSTEYANDLVREASPDDSEDSLREATALLLEIRSLVCKYQLRPCVRTKYTRAAFQSKSNNNLRLTIDRGENV